MPGEGQLCQGREEGLHRCKEARRGGVLAEAQNPQDPCGQRNTDVFTGMVRNLLRFSETQNGSEAAPVVT